MRVRWEIVFASEAEKDVVRLERPIRKSVLRKLDWLGRNFDSITPAPLGAKWRGFYKLRIGDWRVIYAIEWDMQQLFVVAIGHRTKIYRR